MIKTSRLIVRKFEITDAPDLYEYLSDPATYIFEPGQPISLDEAKELARERSQGDNFWAVLLKEEKKLIGHLYLGNVEPRDQLTWELGYIFNRKYQGKGYASEAAAALVEHAFSHLPVHRIMARCNPQNIASWRLLERIGFTREGYFREHSFMHRDESGKPMWTDAYEYSRLG